MQTSTDEWKACAGQTVAVTNKGETYGWTFGNLTSQPPTITQMNTQEGMDGWACQRVLNAVSNVLVEVDACSYHVSNQGSQIADKIAAKATEQ